MYVYKKAQLVRHLGMIYSSINASIPFLRAATSITSEATLAFTCMRVYIRSWMGCATSEHTRRQQHERFHSTAGCGGVQPVLPTSVSDLGKGGICRKQTRSLEWSCRIWTSSMAVCVCMLPVLPQYSGEPNNGTLTRPHPNDSLFHSIRRPFDEVSYIMRSLVSQWQNTGLDSVS